MHGGPDAQRGIGVAHIGTIEDPVDGERLA
jgi:hypothetical protein